MLPVHQVILKLQSQLVIFRLFNVEGEELVLPLHLDGEGGVDHVEAVIQHVANDIAVDGEEPVAGMDTGFCRGGMGGNAIDKNRHFDFISGSDFIFEENELLRYFALKKHFGASAERKAAFLV